MSLLIYFLLPSSYFLWSISLEWLCIIYTPRVPVQDLEWYKMTWTWACHCQIVWWTPASIEIPTALQQHHHTQPHNKEMMYYYISGCLYMYIQKYTCTLLRYFTLFCVCVYLYCHLSHFQCHVIKTSDHSYYAIMYTDHVHTELVCCIVKDKVRAKLVV